MQAKKNSDVTLLDLVAKDSRLTRWNQMIKQSGLAERLSGKEGLTLFAPTDEAFERASADKLAQLMRPESQEYRKQLLLLHILPQAVTVDEMKQAKKVRTGIGMELPVSVSREEGEINLGAAKVLLPMQKASNGYLYPMDHFLQPVAAAAGSTAKA